MRRIIFWTHLIAGTVAGVIILIMSVTGVLLTYEHQILEWANSHYRSVPPSPGAQMLSASDVLARVQRSHGVVPSTITLQAGTDEPLQLSAGRDQTLYVDAYSGNVLGEGAVRIRKFFGAVTAWHRWLGREGEGRAAGRAITGACNLAFLFLVLTGPYLWLPRRWTAQQVRSVALFRGGLSGKGRDFNWHNVIGIWSAVPLFLVVFGGVVISYPWASNLVYRLAGSEPPQQRGGQAPQQRNGPAPGRADGVRRALVIPGVDAAIRNATREVQGWRTITVRLPPSSRTPLSVTVDRLHRGRPDQRVQLTADHKTGAIIERQSFADYDNGRRVRSWLRWIHTGEAAGFAGQTIAGLVSAGAVVLVWTGLSLTWRRARAWRGRTKRQDVPVTRAA